MIENWISHNSKRIKMAAILLVIALFVTIEVSLVYTKNTTGKATIFGYQFYYIMSGSMEPTIKTHQFVIAVPVEAEDIQVGDIVSYRHNDKTIIHRVIGINDDGTIEFQGDHNVTQLEPDKNVTPDQIMCRIIRY